MANNVFKQSPILINYIENTSFLNNKETKTQSGINQITPMTENQLKSLVSAEFFNVIIYSSSF